MNAVELIEVSSPGCHNCAVFRDYWEKEKANWPNVTMREVNLLEPEGQEMVQKYMIMASPGIILNGELFSTGGVTKDKFFEKLKELSGT